MLPGDRTRHEELAEAFEFEAELVAVVDESREWCSYFTVPMHHPVTFTGVDRQHRISRRRLRSPRLAPRAVLDPMALMP